MDFYDLFVEESEVDGMIELAKGLGFSGLGITHTYQTRNELDEFLEKMDKREGKIDLVTSCLLEPENKKDLKRKVGKVRQKVEIVMVNGGDFKINKSAANDSRIDILLHPEYKRKDSGLDHKVAKEAAKNDVTVGFVFHDLLGTYGKIRSHIFDHMKRNLELCKKFNVSYIVVSGAKKKLEMRDPKELASLLETMDLESSESLDAISKTPKRMAKENRKKLNGKVKKKGVEEMGDKNGSA